MDSQTHMWLEHGVWYHITSQHNYLQTHLIHWHTLVITFCICLTLLENQIWLFRVINEKNVLAVLVVLYLLAVLVVLVVLAVLDTLTVLAVLGEMAVFALFAVLAVFAILAVLDVLAVLA